MQLRAESLAGHLTKGLARIYTVHGDEEVARRVLDALVITP